MNSIYTYSEHLRSFGDRGASYLVLSAGNCNKCRGRSSPARPGGTGLCLRMRDTPQRRNLLDSTNSGASLLIHIMTVYNRPGCFHQMLPAETRKHKKGRSENADDGIKQHVADSKFLHGATVCVPCTASTRKISIVSEFLRRFALARNCRDESIGVHVQLASIAFSHSFT